MLFIYLCSGRSLSLKCVGTVSLKFDNIEIKTYYSALFHVLKLIYFSQLFLYVLLCSFIPLF